jgi:arylsulfatase A-like enzyme
MWRRWPRDERCPAKLDGGWSGSTGYGAMTTALNGSTRLSATSLWRWQWDLLAGLAPERGWLAVALGVSLGEIALRAAAEEGLWAHEGFHWPDRVVITAAGVLLVFGCTWPLYWLGCACRAAAGSGHWRRRLAAGLLASAFFVALCGYAVGWLAQWRTGLFPDMDTLYFAARNRTMLWHYAVQAEPRSLVMLGVAAAGAAGVAGWLAWRMVAGSGCGEAPAWRLGDGLLVLALAASSVNGVVLWYRDPPGPVQQSRQWWNDRRPGGSLALAYRLSPVVTLTVGPRLLPAEQAAVTVAPEELGPLKASVPPVRERRPPDLSLILIQIESLRYDVVRRVYQGREVMPTLNRLARGGLLFTRAYAPSTHSNYSDPALLSSLYPLRTVHHHYYSAADPWPKCLVYEAAGRHGCATAVFSSQNETWGGMDQFLKSRHLEVLFDSRSAGVATFVSDSDPGFAQYTWATGNAGKLDDRVTVERAIAWIEQCRRAGRPFCLCLNFQSSHFPYMLPADAPRPFTPYQMDFPGSFVSYPRDKVPVVRNAYYNALSYIDQQLETLVEYLDREDLRERTLLVLIGDNGECFYENGVCTHAGPPFEPAIHVPLIFHCPGRIAPGEEDYLTQGIDVVPTALARMGLPRSPCFQGIDVLAADRPPAERRLALVHNCTLVRATADAVITALGWKYVFDRKTQRGTLYDLRRDPGEQMPLEAQYPAVAQVLDKVLKRWREVQLAYYARPEYYGRYYPPPSPVLSPADYQVLAR